jgi:hypothetical protein
LVFLETARNYLDLVIFSADHKLIPANRWQVFEERTFRSRRNDAPEPREAAVADVTGDHKNDLIVNAARTPRFEPLLSLLQTGRRKVKLTTQQWPRRRRGAIEETAELGPRDSPGRLEIVTEQTRGEEGVPIAENPLASFHAFLIAPGVHSELSSSSIPGFKN